MGGCFSKYWATIPMAIGIAPTRDNLMKFPMMYEVRQIRKVPEVKDIEKEIVNQLNLLGIEKQLKKSATIAITGTSRGLVGGPIIYRSLVSEFKRMGADPFIFPAMGSHGGGTARGQREILASLGLTRDAVGAPIKSSMETVQIGVTRWGFPVLVDKHAFQADFIVLVNRIKPHTNFEGPIESGLLKMLAIGVSKAKGAAIVHGYGQRYGYPQVMSEVARHCLNKLPILFGLAMVENLYHTISIIKAIPPTNMEEEEKKLLRKARLLLGKIPFRHIDLLIVDELGKNISGAGMDSNVIGRVPAKAKRAPKIERIYVRDLTPQSQGNAVGVGNADFISQRFLKKIDLAAMRLNTLSAGVPEQSRLPLPFDTDYEALNGAFATLGPILPEEAKVVWIKNTLALAHFQISEALLAEARKIPYLEVSSSGARLSFNPKGMLLTLWPVKRQQR